MYHAGKTSLLKLLAGRDFPNDGTVTVKNNVHVSYLPQLVELPPQQTALDAVVQSDSPVATIVREYNHLLEQGENVDRQVCFPRAQLLAIPPTLIAYHRPWALLDSPQPQGAPAIQLFKAYE